MFSEKLRGTFADEGHADGEDQASQGGFFAAGDFVYEILGGFFAHAVEIFQRFQVEFVEVGEIFHFILFEELVHDFFAQAVNVHGVAAGEVQQRFPFARGAGDVDAAISDFAFGVMHAHAADRAFFGHLEFFFFFAVLHNFQDVGDYFAGAFDEDCVSGVDAEALDFVHVVQSGFGDGDAADLHRLENGEGSEDAGAAYADFNLFEERGFLVGLIFVGDGPARGFGREAEFVLQADFVYFYYDAVNVVAELFALGVPLGDVIFDFGDAVAEGPVGADFEAQLVESYEDFGVAFFGDAAIHQQVIGEKAEAAGCGEVGIENADGAGGGVARILVALFAIGVLLLVHGFECFAGHDGFAADFEIVGDSGFFEQG